MSRTTGGHRPRGVPPAAPPPVHSSTSTRRSRGSEGGQVDTASSFLGENHDSRDLRQQSHHPHQPSSHRFVSYTFEHEGEKFCPLYYFLGSPDIFATQGLSRDVLRGNQVGDAVVPKCGMLGVVLNNDFCKKMGYSSPSKAFECLKLELDKQTQSFFFACRNTLAHEPKMNKYVVISLKEWLFLCISQQSRRRVHDKQACAFKEALQNHIFRILLSQTYQNIVASICVEVVDLDKQSPDSVDVGLPKQRTSVAQYGIAGVDTAPTFGGKDTIFLLKHQTTLLGVIDVHRNGRDQMRGFAQDTSLWTENLTVYLNSLDRSPNGDNDPSQAGHDNVRHDRVHSSPDTPSTCNGARAVSGKGSLEFGSELDPKRVSSNSEVPFDALRCIPVCEAKVRCRNLQKRVSYLTTALKRLKEKQATAQREKRAREREAKDVPVQAKVQPPPEAQTTRSRPTTTSRRRRAEAVPGPPPRKVVRMLDSAPVELAPTFPSAEWYPPHPSSLTAVEADEARQEQWSHQRTLLRRHQQRRQLELQQRLIQRHQQEQQYLLQQQSQHTGSQPAAHSASQRTSQRQKGSSYSSNPTTTYAAPPSGLTLTPSVPPSAYGAANAEMTHSALPPPSLQRRSSLSDIFPQFLSDDLLLWGSAGLDDNNMAVAAAPRMRYDSSGPEPPSSLDHVQMRAQMPHNMIHMTHPNPSPAHAQYARRRESISAIPIPSSGGQGVYRTEHESRESPPSGRRRRSPRRRPNASKKR